MAADLPEKDWITAEHDYLEMFCPGTGPAWAKVEDPVENFTAVCVAADAGDEDAQRFLRALAIFALEQGHELPRKLRSFVAGDYRRILAGHDPRCVFPVRKINATRDRKLKDSVFLYIDAINRARGLSGAESHEFIARAAHLALKSSAPEGAKPAIGPSIEAVKRRLQRARKAQDKT